MLNMNNEEALAVIFANSYDALIPEMVSERLMASIPFAGRYRLCDFLISSMVHSGIDNISLIVKKNYHSLMDHLGSGQEFDLARKNGGINIVPPYAQKQIKVYEGRVEAIESLKGYLRKCTQKYVIMADANYVFNFDFRELIEAHKNTGADITAMYRKQEVPKVFLRPNGNNDEMYYTFDIDDGRIKITGEPTDLYKIKTAIEEAKPDVEFDVDEITTTPQDYVELEGDDMMLFERLMDLLDDCDDVDQIFHNVSNYDDGEE